MKLAIARQRYNAFGGAERFIERALPALQAQGLQSMLITRRWPEGTAAEVRLCDPFYWGSAWRDASFAKAALAVAQAEGCVLQAHERIPGAQIFRAGDGVHAEWLAQRQRAGLSRWRLRLNPYHRQILALEAQMLAHPALRCVIANSEMVARNLRQHYHLPPEKIRVIRNGVDVQHFHPELRQQHRAQIRQQLGVAADAPVLLLVGSGFARKGLDMLLRHGDQVADDTCLWVVGTDKRMAYWQQQAGPWQGRVRWLGGVQDVRPYYAAADVLALPTWYDPFPNVVIEALACGLPVLTTLQCGGAELITDACLGRVMDAFDDDAWRRALRDLPQWLQVQSRLAARVVALAHDQAGMVQALLQLYADLGWLPAAAVSAGVPVPNSDSFDVVKAVP